MPAEVLENYIKISNLVFLTVQALHGSPGTNGLKSYKYIAF